MTQSELPVLTKKDFESDQDVRWCPGCGDYSILAQTQKTMPDFGVAKEKIVFISGIGCSGRLPYYMNTFGFHTIHGRAATIATGLKGARPDLMVWVITGDGDALSIGGNHLIHAMRRNVDMKMVMFNNRIYGLTKGQASPTSPIGKKTKSTPMGTIETPIIPLNLVAAAEASLIARSVDTHSEHLQETMHRVGEHRGAAFLEVLQNCNIFNDGAWEPLKDADTRDDAMMRLEHGQPIRFGADLGKGVVRLSDGHLAVVDVGKQPFSIEHPYRAKKGQEPYMPSASRDGKRITWVEGGGEPGIASGRSVPTTSFTRLRKAMASRFSRPPWTFGTQSPALRL